MNFENVHKNKKLAFLDGLLCGIVTAFMANEFWKDIQEERRLKKLRETSHQEDPK